MGTMIEVEKEFVSGDGGFSANPLTYKQLQRSGTVALYERSRDGKIKDYEVIIIKMDPKGKVQKFPDIVKKDENGKEISRIPGSVKVLEDDTEKYPTSSQWGHLAWSFHALGGAEDKFDSVVKSETAPEEKEVKLTLPDGEFTTTELATYNKVPYPSAANFVKKSLAAKTIKLLRTEQRAAKGKESNIYIKA
jgi:hypothetical protein